MLSYAALLCGFYVFAKAYARFWLFKSVHERHSICRSNEVLRLIDLAATIALMAVFFILLNVRKLEVALIVTLCLLFYDGVLRFWFLNLEARRLTSSSRRLSRRDALRHVRKRARAPMFH